MKLGRHPSRTAGAIIALTLVAALAASCTEDVFRNLTTALGTGQVGSRGQITVTFVNNTPYRAICTVATYNVYAQAGVPNDVIQFANGQAGTLQLEGNTTVGPQTFQCDRQLSIGGDRMIQRLVDSGNDAGLNEDALRPGVGFSAANADDPLGTLPTEGTAEPVDILQGAEFPCEALIVVTFEEDAGAPGGFRIDYEVILPP